MKSLIKAILSQQTINSFYHFPKAVLANLIYGFPTRGLKIVGVTGTDGKTTTTHMIYQILKKAGKKVSMISTVNGVIGEKTYDIGFHVTSPEPFLIQKLAGIAKKAGAEYLVLEVTSHALDQYRFWGIKFDIGVITNITREHLDYHKTFENYFKTKLKLIQDTPVAIINYSVKQSKIFSQVKGKVITFGLDKGDFNQKEIKLNLKVLGSYNIEDGLAALAVAFVLGIDRKIAQPVLEEFKGIKGRMQEVKNSAGIKIFIDFAHTPNALEQALTTLKLNTKGKLIAVFGAAGKRDEGKRPLMGSIAAKLADIVVITAEDPRGEFQSISQQIISGAIKAGKKSEVNLFTIEDRGKAIDFAINKIAKKGDTVGIFGKGHERSMNLDGKEEIPWSDEEVVISILNQLVWSQKTSCATIPLV